MIMDQRSWTQTDLARELGVSQTWVSQASRGERDPGLARATEYLGRVGWKVHITPKIDGGDPVKRREFMTAVASVTFAPSPRTGPYEDPLYVHEIAKKLDHMRDEQGGVPLVSTALRHIQRIRRAINSADPALQSASSELARKASLILFDAKKRQTAEQAGGLALALARKAGYTEGAAYAFENLCTFSQRVDAHRAATYAERGLRLPGLSDEHRARLNVRLGTSLARTRGHGVQRLTLDALDQAQSIDGMSSATKAMIMGNVGIALRRLGLYDGANTSLAESVRLFRDSPHMHSLYLAHQIKSALASSEPTLAADRMFALTRLVPLIASARLEEHIREILAAAAHWADVPEIRAAGGQLRAVALPSPTGT